MARRSALYRASGGQRSGTGMRVALSRPSQAFWSSRLVSGLGTTLLAVLRIPSRVPPKRPSREVRTSAIVRLRSSGDASPRARAVAMAAAASVAQSTVPSRRALVATTAGSGPRGARGRRCHAIWGGVAVAARSCSTRWAVRNAGAARRSVPGTSTSGGGRTRRDAGTAGARGGSLMARVAKVPSSRSWREMGMLCAEISASTSADGSGVCGAERSGRMLG